MLTEAIAPASAPTATASRTATAKTPRDQRLDFFRGLGMLIIFIAHAPGNAWNEWIPARFGFSSATELFVFCSGLASAIAFGTVFMKRSWLLGTARILFRSWQVYWAHLCLFLALAALAIVVRQLGWNEEYYSEHVDPFARDPATALLGLLTLRWLPAYLDILPMYLIILGMVPVVMALRQWQPMLPFVLVIALYGVVWLTGFNLVGNPWNGFGWFFNPFAWQLIFFAGFAFGMGWIRAPQLNRKPLLVASAVVVVASVPLSFWGVFSHVPALEQAREVILGSFEKTNLHPLRIVHFLATAYLALSFIAAFRPTLDGRIGRHIIKVGQQSLGSFLLSLLVARIAGVALELSGNQFAITALVNLAGIALVIAGAYVAGWFRSAPWSRPRAVTAITHQ